MQFENCIEEIIWKEEKRIIARDKIKFAFPHFQTRQISALT